LPKPAIFKNRTPRASPTRLCPCAGERLVGKQALELEFLKGALRSGPLPRSAPTSVIAGPAGSPSRKDAG
jgi:hypothetical protein